ncbi:MAG: hypothetical protein ACTHNY_06095 [Solirubrobacterales bacterium]
MEVDYGPDSKEQLRSLGKTLAAVVDMELREIFDHHRVPDDFHRLEIEHEPRWFKVNLNGVYAAVIRRCSDEELAAKGAARPRLLCGLLVNAEDDLKSVERQMIKQADDADAAEEDE